MDKIIAYELRQRKITLTVVIWITLAASLILTVYNIQFDSLMSLVSLLGLDLLCVFALILNFYNHHRPAAMIICLMVLAAVTFNIYDGDGLYDSGIIGYAVFIILGSLLLGKRWVPVLTLGAVASVLLVSAFQSRGLLNITIRLNDISPMTPILILLGAAGLIIWVIMWNMERNLSEIRRSEAELLEAYEMTLIGWARALEYRDKETEGHSRRVVMLCETLARRLGCSDEEILHIRRGAVLHDIGKMGVPDPILLKPGPLDEDEWHIMRQHPRYGRDMLAGITFLAPTLDVIYAHHERWDGSGYPQGLRGEEIPLSARIFSIIDNWDALTTDRPYRKAWPQEKVLAYIQENSGTMFDPGVVAEFVNVMKVETPLR